MNRGSCGNKKKTIFPKYLNTIHRERLSAANHNWTEEQRRTEVLIRVRGKFTFSHLSTLLDLTFLFRFRNRVVPLSFATGV